jgi:hypothetical protein
MDQLIKYVCNGARIVSNPENIPKTSQTLEGKNELKKSN